MFKKIVKFKIPFECRIENFLVEFIQSRKCSTFFKDFFCFPSEATFVYAYINIMYATACRLYIHSLRIPFSGVKCDLFNYSLSLVTSFHSYFLL